MGRTGIFAILALLFSSAAWAVDVHEVRLWRAPDHTRIVFDLTGPVDHKLIDAEDIAALMQRLEIWAMRCAEDPRGVDPLYSALSALGSARYGQHESPQSDAWRGVKSALQPTRTKVQYPSRHRPDLPPLNPTTPTV